MSSFDKAAPVFTSRVHSIGPLQSWHWAKTVTYWENTGIHYVLYTCSVYSVVHCHENVLRMWIVFFKRLEKLHMAGKVTKDPVDKVTYLDRTITYTQKKENETRLSFPQKLQRKAQLMGRLVEKQASASSAWSCVADTSSWMRRSRISGGRSTKQLNRFKTAKQLNS